MNHDNIINGNFLLVLIFVFYCLVVYQLITEVLQFYYYHGPKKYFCGIFNILNITSIVLSVMNITQMLINFRFSNSFGSVKELFIEFNEEFTIFLLFIKLVKLLVI